MSFVDAGNFPLDANWARFHSPQAVFYAQDGTIYRGTKEIGPWAVSVFQRFDKVNHKLGAWYEWDNGDGTYTVHFRAIRRLWLKGHQGDEPDIVAPMSWMCTIGLADSEDGHDGLQMKEIRLFWDTGLVVKAMQSRGNE